MTSDPARIERAARMFYDIHRGKKPLPSTPSEIAEAEIDEAYAMQEALQALFIPERGAIVGYKIALTTPVMQQLMGIGQPCAGAIFAKTVHSSPAAVRCSDFGRLAVECEIAIRLGADLPARDRPYTKEDMARAVMSCMPAIELIEDHACDHYKEVGARALIANNAWNAGCVLGSPIPAKRVGDLSELVGSMSINRKEIGRGRGGDVMSGHPFHALAWVANMVATRGRPLRRGMIVLTGSIVSTQYPKLGDSVSVNFTGLGTANVRFV